MKAPGGGRSFPVRVLQVLAQDDLGGTELMLASLLERLDPRRVESELAILSAGGPIAARLEASGVRVMQLGADRMVTAGLRLRRLLRDRGYDIVNPYGFRASLVTRLAARGAAPGTKVMVGVRGLHVTEVEDLESPKARVALAVERMTSRWVDFYDANSQGAVETIAGIGIDRDRIAYIPNGIDLEAWPRRNGRRRPDDGAPLIVSVARFVPRKRHQDLLRALALLRAQGHSFRAVIAGAGPTLEPCRRLCRDLELDSFVKLPGRVDPSEVKRLLAEAEIGCLATLWEGMPGFLMEAMACSVPVVATDVNGPDALIVDGTSGCLVPARDPDRLAAALGRLLEDSALAARLGAGGRMRIEQEFSLDAMVEAKQRLYEGLAG